MTQPLSALRTRARSFVRTLFPSVATVAIIFAAHAIDVIAQGKAKPDSTIRRPSVVYQKGIVPVEQVAGSPLSVNVYAEARKYPKKMVLHATVLDTAGNFVANMAPPYVGADAMRRHWVQLVENLASDRRESVENYTVEEVREEGAVPFAASLVLDYSGSMSGDIEQLESAVRAALAERRAKDLIAITKFDNVERVEQKLTADSIDLKPILRGMEDYGGATALYDGCLSGIAQLASAKDRRILIVFTDGEDNSSLFSSAPDVVKAALENDVTIYTISFAGANRYALDYLASKTGGKAYSSYSSSDFESIIREVFQINKVYYRISYTPPTAEGEHTVDVGVRSGDSDIAIASVTYNREWNMADVTTTGSKLLALFPFDRHRGYVVSEGTMTKLATYLQAHPDQMVVLHGHTDSEGRRGYNRTLSRLRAQRIAADLRRRGVKSSQVAVIGHGEERLMNRPDWPDRMAALENRRVEAEIKPRAAKLKVKRR